LYPQCTGLWEKLASRKRVLIEPRAADREDFDHMMKAFYEVVKGDAWSHYLDAGNYTLTRNFIIPSSTGIGSCPTDDFIVVLKLLLNMYGLISQFTTLKKLHLRMKKNLKL